MALRQDLRDYQIMLWIQKQARYRSRHERQYGRGKPIKRLHPLARIGMSAMEPMTTCKCTSPEPALINHGLDSLCEKCGLLIGPLSADAQAAEVRYQQIMSEWGVGRLAPKPQRP